MKKKMINLVQNPNFKWLAIVLVLLVALAIPGYSWMKADNHARAERRKSLLSPVIMIPGSSATTERFNQLVKQLNQNTPTKHSVLKIKVSTNGTLSYSGKIFFTDDNPANLQNLQEFGITPVLFTTAEKLRADLKYVENLPLAMSA